MRENNAEKRMERKENIPGGAGIHATMPEIYDRRSAQ